MSYEGIDTAAIISADSAKILYDNGIAFAVRYLVPESGYTAWKALSAAEAQDIRNAGLALMLCWETTATRMKGGYDVGKVDGAAAKKLAENMGIPAGTVIYFAADYSVPESDFESVYQYLYAAAVAASPYKAGLYGSENVTAAMNARQACEFYWQCVGGSAKTIQYESQFGSNAQALKQKVGFDVDLDRAETITGMWMPDKPSTEAQDAHKWAEDMGIFDDTMRDVSQTEIMLYRYFRIYQQEDNKWGSGALS